MNTLLASLNNLTNYKERMKYVHGVMQRNWSGGIKSSLDMDIKIFTYQSNIFSYCNNNEQGDNLKIIKNIMSFIIKFQNKEKM